MKNKSMMVSSLNAKIEVNAAQGVGKYSIVAIPCGQFSALNKLSWPVNQMQLRGYGKSVAKKVEGAFELHNYLADVDSVISSVNTEKTVLFGYSHGGYFATMHAIANPNNLAALILVEPALYTPRNDLLDRARMATEGKALESVERMLRFVDPKVGLKASESHQVAKTVLENVNDKNALAQEFRVRAENPIADENLSRLNMPVLLIGGTESPVNSMVKRAFQAIPHASVFWVRGATHLSLQGEDYSQQISDVMDNFLKSLS